MLINTLELSTPLSTLVDMTRVAGEFYSPASAAYPHLPPSQPAFFSFFSFFRPFVFRSIPRRIHPLAGPTRPYLPFGVYLKLGVMLSPVLPVSPLHRAERGRG